jgi:hypothetical protein
MVSVEPLGTANIAAPETAQQADRIKARMIIKPAVFMQLNAVDHPWRNLLKGRPGPVTFVISQRYAQQNPIAIVISAGKRQSLRQRRVRPQAKADDH